jgi:DNA-binding NtrC family response regulator
MVQTSGKILVVDDELVVRDSLCKWFCSEGYLVQPAASARQALEATQQVEYDLALIDIKMPGMDGMELQDRLWETNPRLIIIIMTGFPSDETAVQAFQRGAYAYVTKPVDPDELSHLVADALKHRCEGSRTGASFR